MRSSLLGSLLVGGLTLTSALALAQSAPPTATGTFPPEQPPPAQPTQPAPAQPAPAQPAPTQPPPAQQPYPPQQQQGYPPPQQQQGYPPPQQQTYPPPQQGYPPPEQGYQNQGYEPPPPPPPKKPDGGLPPWSVRADPLSWLLEGRLGLELEVGVLDWLSVEVVPVFVVNDQPPAFNFSGREDSLSQESNGLGPISGASISAGFWLEGKAMKGYVLRAILTNYGYTYKGSDKDGVFDQLSHTERQFYGYLGSHSRIGAFTLAGGIGLGVELNREKRCFEQRPLNPGEIPQDLAISSGCPDDELLLATDRRLDEPVANFNGGIYPVQLMLRFSLGVTID